MKTKDKEVYFDQYCPTCFYNAKKESDDPCDECMEHPSNVDSHKPINWEEK